jgi:4-aminobutyrate aminotransferase-like enzyme
LVRDPQTQIPAAQEARTLINRMREHGVLINRIGPHGNVLKIRPPMPFAKQHADILVGTLERALAEL